MWPRIVASSQSPWLTVHQHLKLLFSINVNNESSRLTRTSTSSNDVWSTFNYQPSQACPRNFWHNEIGVWWFYTCSQTLICTLHFTKFSPSYCWWLFATQWKVSRFLAVVAMISRTSRSTMVLAALQHNVPGLRPPQAQCDAGLALGHACSGQVVTSAGKIRAQDVLKIAESLAREDATHMLSCRLSPLSSHALLRWLAYHWQWCTTQGQIRLCPHHQVAWPDPKFRVSCSRIKQEHSIPLHAFNELYTGTLAVYVQAWLQSNI